MLGNKDGLNRTDGWLQVATMIVNAGGDAATVVGSSKVDSLVVGDIVDARTIVDFVTTGLSFLTMNSLTVLIG